MSKESIENRRAFFKKIGKTAGLAALAVPFLAATAKADSVSDQVGPVSSSCSDCSGGCKDSCSGCSGRCGYTCSSGR